MTLLVQCAKCGEYIDSEEAFNESPEEYYCFNCASGITEDLLKSKEELLESIGSYLHILAIIRDADKFKEFIKYIHRWTSSEVQFLLEEHGFREDISDLVDRLAEKKAGMSKG